MSEARSWVRMAWVLCLGLLTACATSRASEGEPRAVSVSELPGGRVRLSFEPVAADPSLDVLSVAEAQAALTVFHSALLVERPEIRVLPPARLRLLEEDDGGQWEQHLREQFLSRFGGALLPLPKVLGQSRFYQALKLSPRYMGAGVREAAQELFSSPVFVASVFLSVAVYFGAWLVPEPLFSKAFAVTLTAALAITVGLMEVVNLALACLRLYRESESARTQKEVEAASEHFGRAMGGTMLRVLVMVASMGVARTAPTLPPGGLGALLGKPLYTVRGGLAVEAAATAQVAGDGSLILSGVATGEMATRLCGGLTLCSTMDDGTAGPPPGPKLSTRYGPPHTRQNPLHNEAIEEELASRESARHTQLLKNKAQLDADNKPALDKAPGEGPRFRRPDAASLRPDGVRHNTNYVSNVRDLKRELVAARNQRKMARTIDTARIRDELVQAFKWGEEDRVRALLPQLGLSPKQVRAELEAMLNCEDSLVRQAAAFGLGELGGAASARRLEEQLAIEEARRSYDGEAVVEDIVRALGRIAEASARAPLIRRLERLAAAGQPDAADVIALARALWRRRHPDLLPAVRRSLERISLPAPHGLHGLVPLLEKTPPELDTWARDPTISTRHKTRVLVVLEEDVPDELVPVLPAFIASAEALDEQALSHDRDAAYYCECLLSMHLSDRERLLPALPEDARLALRTVALRLIRATFPNPSISAAVVLGIIGRHEDAPFLEAHSPEYPTLAKVFRDAARTLRDRH
ncbi:HEAT repeat domain-containing protein [Hyalangium gracile]|uniref:HEAT repeat domain-containing protein n=1 Tax=Hyalangium gracile TaxID=394092 RepID=UPI001CCFD562|nr:hypothetical protein [Hyalangium gracile]